MDIYLPVGRVTQTDPNAIIEALIDFVNDLRRAYYHLTELPQDAVNCYYVDYYLQQVENGGVSQFIYNSRTDPVIFIAIRAGLANMHAQRHLRLFQQVERHTHSLGTRLTQFLLGDYIFSHRLTRRSWDKYTEQFFDLERSESLREHNSALIRRLPNVRIVDDHAYQTIMQELRADVPDREQRRDQAERRAKEQEPPEYAHLRQLCQLADQTFVEVKSLRPRVEHGKSFFEWRILTSEGPHYAIFNGTSVTLFDSATNAPVATKPL
jgi:hypothetical protein